MKCETVRAALSARIDGEQEPIPADTTDRHLSACPACQDWYRRAEALRRATILHTAPEVPDLTAAIMARLPPRREHPYARVALGVVAAAQTVLALTQLFGVAGGHGHEAFMMGHMSHESAAWNVAIGIGLVWAALRTRAAAGQLPMLTVFVGVLTAASLLDLTRGDVTAARLVSHIPVVLGVALLYLVYRRHRDDDHPDHAAALTPSGTSGADSVESRPTPRVPGKTFGHQRPASHHRAA
ncbi:zf-HC2 domain-containing protein [Nocardia wallacei]|uniref:Membrane protein n=1 Tax=Nocardia wallacei TaxID=480035 RepID=A0A7G1KP34_9NOCA|nr:zf-HC2 domain-containing protein [Nocardia wallacei]BCK55993.1 membrane protein [Nocardia wallacei]